MNLGSLDDYDKIIILIEPFLFFDDIFVSQISQHLYKSSA